MLEIDRWVMARYASVASRMVHAYDEYDYSAIYQAANSFVTVDLSAFYVDVTKDRMYTFGATSAARRSGQTAMFHIADGLARLLAPVLVFTMDEVWRNLPGEREASVHLTLFPSGLSKWQDEGLLQRWAQLSSVRDQVNLALEEQRQQKVITSSLSARVVIGASGPLAELLGQYRQELPSILGVSQVDLEEGSPGGAAVTVSVHRAHGTKCERCWRYVPSVSDVPEYRGLCERCVDALSQPPELGRAS